MDICSRQGSIDRMGFFISCMNGNRAQKLGNASTFCCRLIFQNQQLACGDCGANSTMRYCVGACMGIHMHTAFCAAIWTQPTTVHILLHEMPV